GAGRPGGACPDGAGARADLPDRTPALPRRTLVRGGAAVMPGPITRRGGKRRRRASNPLPRFGRPPAGRQPPAPCVLRPSLARPCPRQESNPVLDLRRVVCAPVTP